MKEIYYSDFTEVDTTDELQDNGKYLVLLNNGDIALCIWNEMLEAFISNTGKEFYIYDTDRMISIRI